MIKRLLLPLLALLALAAPSLAQAPAPVRTPATIRCTAAPTVTAASAYASGNIVGGLITCINAVRAAGLGGIFQTAWLTDKSGQVQPYELWPFTSPPMTATVTVTIATPGVVSWSAHGLANGAKVVLSTTGALPTGLTAGTTYFVVSSATNTFQLAATSGGSAINTTGTQSGVHTANAALDKSPIALNATDLARLAGPPISLSGTALGNTSTMGITGLGGLGQSFVAAPDSTTIYLLPVTRGTPTYTATGDVGIGVNALPD